MLNQVQTKVPANGARVNIHDPNEITYWSAKFACTPERLRNIVSLVGSRSDLVALALRGHLPRKHRRYAPYFMRALQT
jgi:hypothetical protein